MKSFGDLVKQAQKIQKQMSEVQDRLANDRYEASAGGGLVKAVVDGKQKLIQLTIQPDALKEEAAVLEDLVLTAVGEAQRTSEERMKEALGPLTGGMSLPF
ncbi:MAG: YbaB/EbfC family nucleoid-associated protein [Candidatus Eisenbacteria bacterium]|uniref:Nucleoid-associated protein E6K80_13560 n=1 Tax=Eiseniibacteriota bacterium TaxID=2212470 RepID=A0A538TZ48_UNCEI|nr:MAG: YbaB/EbfC family nucleoid-associated protein [Candidatus Eisenbacteria bacterium]